MTALDGALTRAQQGHRYAHGDTPVLALDSGEVVRVAELVPGQPWLGSFYNVRVAWLRPLPMVYFHGEVPK